MTNLAYKQRANRVNARKDAIEQNRIRIGFERKLRLQLQTAFAEIGQWASDSYERIARVPNTQFIPNKISSILLPHYRSVIESFAKRFQTYQKQEAEFDRIINSFLRTQGGIHITQVSDTTRKRIMRAIQVAQADDLSVALTAKAILDSQTGFISKRRASTIARTETHTAASFANHEMAKDSQIPNLQKQWVAVNDARTRGAHSAVSGTIIPMDEDFDVVVRGITYKMGYPSDPRGGAANVVNCRCTLIYVTPEDEVIVDEDTILGTDNETPPIDNIYGSVTPEEKLFHDQGGWNQKSTVFKVVALTRPVDIIRVRERGFYQEGRKGQVDPRINMPTPIKVLEDNGNIGLRERSTWRHEYGHHIDYMMGGYLRGFPRTLGISSQIKNELVQDKKQFRKPVLKKKDQDAENNIIDFLNKEGLDIDKQEFAKRPSFYTYQMHLNDDRTTNGKFAEYLTKLQFDEKIVNKVLKDSEFDFKDIETIFGGGIDGESELLKSVNKNTRTKSQFLYFLNDLKVNRIGGNASRAGYSNWIDRNAHMSEGNYFSDYLASASNTAVARGHAKSYYSDFLSLGDGVRMSHTTEMMANYVTLMGTDRKRADVYRKLMKRTTPKSLEKLDELFDEMSKVEKMPDDF